MWRSLELAVGRSQNCAVGRKFHEGQGRSEASELTWAGHQGLCLCLGFISESPSFNSHLVENKVRKMDS